MAKSPPTIESNFTLHPEHRPNSRVSFNTTISRPGSGHAGDDIDSMIRPYIGTPTARDGDSNSSTRDNLKLFPSRHNNPYIVGVGSMSPSSSKGHSHPNGGGRNGRDTLEKPLIINNGNISSTNGRNGVALNQLASPANGNGTTVVRNGKSQYQRLRPVGVKQKVWRDSFKVIAFICGSFAVILLVMGLASSEWLLADRYRQGLFVYCVEGNVSTVPFVQTQATTKDRLIQGAGEPDPVAEASKEGCHRIDLNVQGYTLVAAAFCVISLCVDLFATGLTALGLRCRDPNRKYKYYRVAVYVMALALVAVLVALVVYPVCFAQIMEKSQRPVWEFGWAYGVAWGASIFLFGGVILLLCDKESEEIYYKERTIVYTDTNNKV